MAVKKKGKKKRNGKMKNQKGLSAIVITLILVVISLVAVGILWNTIQGLIKGQTQIAQIQSQFFSEQINIKNVYFEEPFVNMTIRKPAGEIKSSSVNLTLAGGPPPGEADIFSVVDLSGSMRECNGSTLNSARCNIMGGGWTSPVCGSLNATSYVSSLCIGYGATWNDKLTATQNANKDMITSLLSSGSNRIGLIAYKNIVIDSNSTSLTNNAVLLNTVMNSWQAGSMTCICCGINNASLKLSQQSTAEKPKSIIVMSDGVANVNCSGGGSNNAKNDSVKAACNANSSLNKLVIYSIGVMGADEATLTEIAKCGGGKYFSVTNTSELISTYQAIAQEILESYQSVTSLSYLSIIFFNGTNSVKEKIFDIPAVLETKTYNFNLQGMLSGKITRIEIYPVVVIESTKREVIGPLLDVWVAR